jgi:hypothetical protein
MRCGAAHHCSPPARCCCRSSPRPPAIPTPPPLDPSERPVFDLHYHIRSGRPPAWPPQEPPQWPGADRELVLPVAWRYGQMVAILSADDQRAGGDRRRRRAAFTGRSALRRDGDRGRPVWPGARGVSLLPPSPSMQRHRGMGEGMPIRCDPDRFRVSSSVAAPVGELAGRSVQGWVTAHGHGDQLLALQQGAIGKACCEHRMPDESRERLAAARRSRG